MTSNDHQKSEQRPQTNAEWIIETIVSLGLAILIILTFRSSILEAFKIPSGSMIPNLLVGDHILVNKLAYDLKVPFSDDLTRDPIYIFKRENPKRGDIIVFRWPENEKIYFIKRVIGLPGDTIEMRNKILFINNKMVTRDRIQDSSVEQTFENLDSDKYLLSNLELYMEHLDTMDHRLMIDKASYASENFPPRQVPADQFFVMGDNRDYSNDSRSWGYVPRRNIKGRAVVVFFSFWINFNEWHSILPSWDELKITFRPSRMGTLIR